MSTIKLNEDVVKTLPSPAAGNRVTYFAGAKIQGSPAPSGFGVRVTATGAKSFVLNYRIGAKERRYTIGSWPDWSALQAVRAARTLRQRVDRGEDPQSDKENTRRPLGGTVSDLLNTFVAEYVRSKTDPLRSAHAIERTI